MYFDVGLDDVNFPLMALVDYKVYYKSLNFLFFFSFFSHFFSFHFFLSFFRDSVWLLLVSYQSQKILSFMEQTMQVPLPSPFSLFFLFSSSFSTPLSLLSFFNSFYTGQTVFNSDRVFSEKMGTAAEILNIRPHMCGLEVFFLFLFNRILFFKFILIFNLIFLFFF